MSSRPSPRLRPLFAVLAIAAAVGLSACAGPSEVAEPSATAETPTPTPTPTEEPVTRPSVDELVITPDGMGTLVMNQAPSTDPEQRMIEEDPAACASPDLGIEPGDPEALRWVPIDAYETDGYAPWGVSVVDGILLRIDVRDASIPTDKGIRIGHPGAAALEAYPDGAVVDELLTDVLVVPGEHGVLHIEIAKEMEGELAGYWGDQVGTVVYIRAVDLASGVFTVAASDNVAGGCL